MLRSVRCLTIPCLIALAAAGCQDSGVATGGLIGGGREANSFTVLVGPGLEPRYSWTGGAAYSVSVVRTSNPTAVVWGIATPETDGISSGAIHGVVADGVVSTALPSDEEVRLVEGVEYRVSVSRLDQTFGFTGFTP